MGWVVVGQGIDVPLLEVPDHVGELVARPGSAALEEGEAKLREPGHHTTEEQRAANRFAAGREVADVVGHVVVG